MAMAQQQALDSQQHAEAPCPDRIIDDIGGAFAMGAVGGGAFHFFKGMKNSPRGYRLKGGFQAATLRAPTLGGSFGVWGGLFSTFDCTFKYIRKKEDPWNSVAAGAATGGFLAARSGPKGMLTNAVVGGVLLGMIEGLQILMFKAFAPAPPPPPVQAPVREGANKPKPQRNTWLDQEEWGEEEFGYNFADEEDY